uniref:Uncharacterized protein n=1 Tax=Aegilops tauschii TaxID=37682 RepID=M8C685_AEGTA
MVSGDGGGRMPSTQFAKHVVAGRWFMFFASILIMAAAGGTYIFAIYSKAIKSSLGYDQQTLHTLSFFKDVGANVGILPGLINEVTPPKYALEAIIKLSQRTDSQKPVLFAIISEVFGLKYYSTLYNFGAVASPVGSYILNVRIAGHRYDEEALRQGGRRGNDLTCIGVRCFRESFYIIAGVTLLGALVSLLLAWRTRNFYRGDLYGKFNAELAMGPPGPAQDRPEQATTKGAATSSDNVVATNGGKIRSVDH